MARKKNVILEFCFFSIFVLQNKQKKYSYLEKILANLHECNKIIIIIMVEKKPPLPPSPPSECWKPENFHLFLFVIFLVVNDVKVIMICTYIQMEKIVSEKLSSALCKEFKYNFFSKEKDQINDDDEEKKWKKILNGKYKVIM